MHRSVINKHKVNKKENLHKVNFKLDFKICPVFNFVFPESNYKQLNLSELHSISKRFLKASAVKCFPELFWHIFGDTEQIEILEF